jgi:hypothetical protein
MLSSETVGARTTLARILWSAALAGCGRVGFESAAEHAADAMLVADVAGGSPAAEVDAQATFTVTCGTAAAPQNITVTNVGNAVLVISDATANGGFSVTTSLPITIAPGTQATLTVQPPDAVIGTDLGGSMKTGELTLTTNDPATPTPVVALQAMIEGANIQIVDGTGMGVMQYAFDDTAGACPGYNTFGVVNSGTQAIAVTFGDELNLDLTGFSSGMTAIDVDQTVVVMAKPRTVGTSCTGTGHVQYTVTGAVCTTSPTVLQTTLTITGGSGFCNCP